MRSKLIISPQQTRIFLENWLNFRQFFRFRETHLTKTKGNVFYTQRRYK
ncbi:hypothetical protein LEP1GSC036_1057 [Leptospira weilii str. 2006001853]|uniref:Uncharacterized protein n=1 Tax=Leptospira weilii str. 2006001853 TaxID=1001589 RepID=A0A828Z1Y6_9LEPT|nr:hypothetical protein LEP1GSC036_1057 [Leptospira weilii str. 2006001853]QDK23420.1 hydroxyacid dehydrogenase [Leptospira weilii]QDK26938.1 hydroxyacid dehydrogenase [Leptospira weilii]